MGSVSLKAPMEFQALELLACFPLVRNISENSHKARRLMQYMVIEKFKAGWMKDVLVDLKKRAD